VAVVRGAAKNLSRELRGYADQYQCLLVRCWRRCQAFWALASAQLIVGDLRLGSREFCTGRLIWRLQGLKYVNHSGGSARSVDVISDALKQNHEGSEEKVKGTELFWKEGFNWTIYKHGCSCCRLSV